MSILSPDSTIEIFIIGKVDTAGNMCQIHNVLVVVDDCVITIVWYDLRMEEINLSQDGWLIYCNIGDISLVDVPYGWVTYVKFHGVGDIWANNIVMKGHLEKPWVIRVILFGYDGTCWPQCHIVI